MPANFIPNPAFIKSREAAALLEGIGDDVIDAAEAKAPHLTGHLAGSFVGELVDRGDGVFVWRVISTDFKAGFQEFGTVNMPGRHYLAAAVMQRVGNLE